MDPWWRLQQNMTQPYMTQPLDAGQQGPMPHGSIRGPSGQEMRLGSPEFIASDLNRQTSPGSNVTDQILPGDASSFYGVDDSDQAVTTPRTIKNSRGYFDATLPLAIDYRRRKPGLRFQQNLTPEAYNKGIDVHSGAGAMKNPRGTGLYNPNTGDISINPKNLNGYPYDQVLQHEATHAMQDVAFQDTHWGRKLSDTFGDFGAGWYPQRDEMKAHYQGQGIPEKFTNYVTQKDELEAYISPAKQWYYNKYGKPPETAVEFNTMIDEYRNTRAGQHPFWQNKEGGNDEAFRRTIQTYGPGIVSNNLYQNMWA